MNNNECNYWNTNSLVAIIYKYIRFLVCFQYLVSSIQLIIHDMLKNNNRSAEH